MNFFDNKKLRREQEKEIQKQQQMRSNLSILGTKTDGFKGVDVEMVKELKTKFARLDLIFW